MAATAAAFNGGRSQTGSSFIQTGGEWPFLNVLKTAQEWANSGGLNGDGLVDPATLDENGYPTSGAYYTVCYVPLSWVGQSITIQWDGGGEIRVPGSSAVGSVTSSNGSTNNSITCTCVDQRLLPGVVSTSASPNHIKNIRISLTGTETTALNAGDVFRPAFKDKLLEGGFGVIRFLDWQFNNTTNVTTWAMRKPLGYYSYHASEFRNTASTGRPKLYCGNTTNSGNAYSITGNGDGVPSSGAPVHMQMIQLHFNADATKSGGATLNLNAAGAKSILDWSGNPLSDGNNSYPAAQYFSKDTYGTLVFDSELDAWMLFGAQLAWGGIGIMSGVPPEICLQLCAEIGAHPYFLSPRFALEAPTDFMPSLAAYCRDNAPSWMVPRFEGPNEMFNTANASFHNGSYGNKKATTKWGTGDYRASAGYWHSILGQAVASAYSIAQANTKTQTRYHLVCGVQTGFGTASAYDEYLSSATYIAQVPAAPAGYSKAVGVAEAWRWVTHIATTQYFTPADYSSPEETQVVAAYQTADARSKNDMLDNYIDSLIRTNPSGNTNTIPNILLRYADWKQWAQGFSVNKMCGYEGGFSPDYTGGGSSNADRFRNDCKARAAAAVYLQAMFQGFLSFSDDTFTAEFPSNLHVGDFTYDTIVTSSAWSLLKGDFESANTPMFDFIIRFNKGRRAISPRLRLHG